MNMHARVRSSMAASIVTMGALASNIAAAAAPQIVPATVNVDISNQSAPVVLNLLEIGVLVGAGPLVVTQVEFLSNGVPAPGLVATSLYQNNGPGAVCISVGNVNFSPSSAPLALRLSARNQLGQSVGPVDVPINDAPGPAVNTSDPQQTLACDDRNSTPQAVASNQTVSDTDQQPGEDVTLDGSGSFDPDADNTLSYQWYLDDVSLGTTPVLTVRLPDGDSGIVLVVTDDSGDGSTNTSIANFTVTVQAAVPATLFANAGEDRSVDDSDGLPGESVTLDGSASAASVGTITSYDWYLDNDRNSRVLLGSGVSITATLPDGVNTVTLEVGSTAEETSSDSVQITVAGAPDRAVLSELQNLTPNQKRMAAALDGVCARVLGSEDPPASESASKPAVAFKATAFATEAEQSDLATKCRGLLFNNTAANQVQALDELNGQDFAAARTQTLLFANFQYAGILDRLMALRGGARGLSLAGLNVIIDGKPVPVATLQQMAGDLLGGGAASDADEVGGLLSDKWGLWMRGNYSSGKKDASASSPSFDADQFALISGLDYRLSEKAVVGISMAYGDSSVDFNPRGEGSLDTQSWAVSAYGSVYAAQNFYLDAVFNVSDSDYAADRNIVYVDGAGLVTADARGDTGGTTLSGGVSLGYDILVKGLTISPNLGTFYIDAAIDSFTERGAGGLNLIYDKQKFQSMTANLGVRVTYAWNLPWAVLLPHVRVDYVREFEDDVDVFGVRFAADPNAGSTPPILVETDNPDTSYWRLAAGLSAQFKLGISGYVEYQRLQSFQFISFQDVSMGLRMQKSF